MYIRPAAVSAGALVLSEREAKPPTSCTREILRVVTSASQSATVRASSGFCCHAACS
jgi:hypothetical protein